MEIFNRGTGPSKTDKLRNVNPVRCSTRNIPIQMWIINYSKIKIVPLIVNLGRNNPFNMERSKSKNGAEKLDSFVLFRRNSFGYIKRNKVSKTGCRY